MFKQWTYDDSQKSYRGIHETEKRLPPGIYSISLDMNNNPVANRRETRTDSMTRFQSGPLAAVLKEADDFWRRKDRYAAMGLAHKRGVLLHGPHGCGKSGIINVLVDDVVRRDGLAFYLSDPEDFGSALVLIRQIEHDRPILAVIEDIDSVAKHYEEELLALLDGASSVSGNILFVATTNYLSKVPDRIRCRPSRIDTLIEVSPPGRDQRQEYLRFVLQKVENGEADKLSKKWASLSKGLSLADLKEMAAGCYVYGQEPQAVVARLHSAKENKE